MSCPRCRGGQLVEIQLTLAGEHITMQSCSRCDSRWWSVDGRQVPLDGVLDLAATRR